jgi:transcriptional regulator with XRE-family HTH domain
MDQVKKGRVDAIDTYVGRKLRDRRVLLGLNQNELGEAVNVSIQQIQKYESAKNRISCGKLYNFAKLLRVPIEYFFEGIQSLVESNQTANPIFAEDQQEFIQDKPQISDKELVNLIKAYSKINNEAKRRSVFDLVKALSTIVD